MHAMRIRNSVVLIGLAVLLSACGGKTAPQASGESDPSSTAADWKAAAGLYARADSNQFDHGLLQLKDLGQGTMLFEFALSEGSESADVMLESTFAGILQVDEKGVGQYETHIDAEYPGSVTFTVSEDGQTMTVKADGSFEISPAGQYQFSSDRLMFDSGSAICLLQTLPTAATSLRGDEYTFGVPPEDTIDDWFYRMEVTRDDDNAMLAQFLVAQDFSAVFRADDDIEPVLIFGSVQPMLDALTPIQPSNPYAPMEADGQYPYVYAYPVHGAAMDTGDTRQLLAVLPGGLPYQMTAEASDPSVAAVDENGVVTAIGSGAVTIRGQIIVADGTKPFALDMTVA